MPHKSPYEPLDIPKCNLLSYLFPLNQEPSNRPLWIDVDKASDSLSQAEMLMYIRRFALGLDRLGVGDGEVVMVFTPNHIFVPVAYLGAAGSKHHFTGANPTYTVKEVAHQIKVVKAAVLLIHPSLLDTGLAAAKEAKIPLNRIFQFSAHEVAPVAGVYDWRLMLASEGDARSWMWDPLEGDASTTTVAAINFSSGTTGLPKGVCVSHYNLIANAMQVIFNKFHGLERPQDGSASERWLAFLPLYHAYSQLWTINIACKLGASVYLVSKFNFSEFLYQIQRFKVTAIQAVPPLIIMLGKRPETAQYDISSLKYILSGAAPLSADLQNEVSTRFDLTIVQGWGMTETTCAGIMIPGMMKDLSGSIGYLLPNTEAMLCDEEGNEVLGDNARGELWLRGPQIMCEYWMNPSATKSSKTEDGWFKTGDVALCKDEMWWIVDRKKELIKVNGLQVSPAELEAILLEMPEVADAAVVGIVLGGEELPRAYVALQPASKGKTTEADIRRFMHDRVAKYKRLAGGIMFLDEIPKLPSGKIVRKLVKEWAKRDARALEGSVRPRI